MTHNYINYSSSTIYQPYVNYKQHQRRRREVSDNDELSVDNANLDEFLKSFVKETKNE